LFNETCNTCSYSNHLIINSPILISNKIYQLLPFDQSHPLALNRIMPVIGLAQSLNWLDESQYKESSIASVDMLARYHNIDYVEAVLSAENNRCIPGTLGKRFNLGRHGNSYFSKIFTRPATTAGASILAGQLLAENEEGIIFSPAGGNHHAKKNQAAGFCIFNDPVLGILSMLDNGLKKVLYVDLDAHHGDGVQEAFQHDDRVFTISIHEKNRWPYTGKISERGLGNTRKLSLSQKES